MYFKSFLFKIYFYLSAAGTPFVSFFEPNEMLALAREADLKEAKTLPPAARWF